MLTDCLKLSNQFFSPILAGWLHVQDYVHAGFLFEANVVVSQTPPKTFPPPKL